MSGIDTKIEPLVKFLNQLDGVITIGSCQGHDDGGGSGEWVYPYVKFKCTNNRTLGFLAFLEDAYKSMNEQAKLKYFNSSLAFEPDLNGDWCIEVVKNIDFNEQHKKKRATGLIAIKAFTILIGKSINYENNSPAHRLIY